MHAAIKPAHKIQPFTSTHRCSFMQRLLHNVHSLLNTLVNSNSSRRHNTNRTTATATTAAAAKGAAAAAAAGTACKSICAFGVCEVAVATARAAVVRVKRFAFMRFPSWTMRKRARGRRAAYRIGARAANDGARYDTAPAP